MLIIRDLKLTLGARTLFENTSFHVNRGDRVAFDEPDGAGKPMLFSLTLSLNQDLQTGSQTIICLFHDDAPHRHQPPG